MSSGLKKYEKDESSRESKREEIKAVRVLEKLILGESRQVEKCHF
jgi:hypothetical protein